MERLLDCVAFYEVIPLVFGTWNLQSIEPNPSMAVNFRGPPGTGKTLAAHAIAHRLGLRIVSARLSDLESKFHGDGPKNLAALFATAARERALLFIDEAESLLSRRFAQPEQAAESAINSMRTELLQALDAFKGLVIFASNLPHSYDAAIESRLFHVDFALPDRDTRLRIWRAHLPPQLPLAPGVSLEALAAVENVSGRDIKLAVIMAAVSTARRRQPAVSHALLQSALMAQRDQAIARLERDGQGRLNEEEEATVADLVREKAW
jgi:SpoVK/Ycf46/Vps4 family AAA+-type ATPase